MEDSMTFKYYTEITVDREEVIERLKDDGFFDVEDEDGDISYDEEAIESYEPTYEDYESIAREKFMDDDCEYYGPEAI